MTTCLEETPVKPGNGKRSMEVPNGNGNGGWKLWLVRGIIGVALSLGGYAGKEGLSTLSNHSSRLTVIEERQKSTAHEIENLRRDVTNGFERQDHRGERLEDKFDRAINAQRHN